MVVNYLSLFFNGWLFFSWRLFFSRWILSWWLLFLFCLCCFCLSSKSFFFSFGGSLSFLGFGS